MNASLNVLWKHFILMDTKWEVKQPMNAVISHCLLPLEEFGARKEGDGKQLQ